MVEVSYIFFEKIYFTFARPANASPRSVAARIVDAQTFLRSSVQNVDLELTCSRGCILCRPFSEAPYFRNIFSIFLLG